MPRLLAANGERLVVLALQVPESKTYKQHFVLLDTVSRSAPWRSATPARPSKIATASMAPEPAFGHRERLLRGPLDARIRLIHECLDAAWGLKEFAARTGEASKGRADGTVAPSTCHAPRSQTLRGTSGTWQWWSRIGCSGS